MPPKMYAELASWFHLITAPEDYEEEAAFFTKMLRDACDRPPQTVLELGSGGGNNASHMKAHFEMTLVDLSPDMLALSKTINPELEHIEGDMRNVRLRREFDAVFVHDAVSYMLTKRDLRAAFKTAFLHCRPGGAALFAPDDLVETFEEKVNTGGHDSPALPGGSADNADNAGGGIRYIEWTADPNP
ncbi:MAG: class I SAM-dependent methyltransferase, partial [Chloroflexi bacterium]|nr:class I SAM-dependent methyltransferase [Chloroflexota bacterium]